MSLITKEELLESTDGGMQIFEYLYGNQFPSGARSGMRKDFQFCIDGENHASASFKLQNDGNWVLTVFNQDSTPRNAVDHWKYIRGLKTLPEAIEQICREMGLNVEGRGYSFSRPERLERAAGDEPQGWYRIEAMENFTEQGARVMGALARAEVCREYGMVQIFSYSYRRDERIKIVKASDQYPIFALLADDWAKIYEPLNQDKAYRFRYFGKKPKNILFGKDHLKKMFEDFNKPKEEEESSDDLKGDGRGTGKSKLECAFLMSGERDAMNMAGAGYPVVWMNSETAEMSEDTYGFLMSCVKTLYYVPDLDATGLAAARRLCLRYTDIRMIVLPEEVRQRRYRGKPGKDFRDWVDLQDLTPPGWVTDPEGRQRDMEKRRARAVKRIRELMESACPMRFLDRVTERSKSGMTTTRYVIRPAFLYHFLHQMGYGVIASPAAKEGFQIVQVSDGVFRTVKSAELSWYVMKYARERHFSAEMIDAIARTKILSESSAYNLAEFHPDFTSFGADYQWMFFPDKAWKVTASGIEEFKTMPEGVSVWEKNLIPHRAERSEEPFSISWNPERGEYDIDIKNTDSNYFRLLINTSRMHWAEEMDRFKKNNPGSTAEDYYRKMRFCIDSEYLTPEEAEEHRRHLVNKIFSIGYLLHRYKDFARTWAVYGMDNKIAAASESHGRSGKSLVLGFLKRFSQTVDMGGRNRKLTEGEHIYGNVTKFTDLIFIDDANRYLDFDFFFPVITGGITVNPKNVQQYFIPFEDTPKLIITSNFPLRAQDPSTEARILYVVFSDWYHQQTINGDYPSTHNVSADFSGRTLFDADYTAREWSDDIHFLARCLQFYLSTRSADTVSSPDRIKVSPPMKNVRIRAAIASIGEDFIDWADVYFAEQFGVKINKADARLDFLMVSGTRSESCKPTKFKNKLKDWCWLRGYVLNRDANTRDGRIVSRNPITKKTDEFIRVEKEQEKP